jgi:hypothetical protein
MPVITTPFKKLVAEQIIADFNSPTNYYFVGIGRSQLWNDSDITVPEVNNYRDRYSFQQNLQGVKQIADVSMVVTRVNWSSGTIYSAWDDTQVGNSGSNYYVITSLNQVYLCLRAGRTTAGVVIPSVVEPTGTTVSLIKQADGYIWKYLYTLSSLETSRFLAANFIPVKVIDSADNVIQALQKAVQDAALPGQISRVVLTSNGTGYTSAPSVTIIGDGTLATATAVVFGGAVVNVLIDSNGSGQLKGSGYKQANVVISGGGGSGAAGRAVLSPRGGFGKDARDDLRSTAIMFNGRPSDTEGGQLLIDQDFRQVGIIRNIKKTVADSDFTSGAANSLPYMIFNAGATAFTTDNIVVGTTSGAKGIIDQADSSAGLLYHQTEETGFKSFQNGEALTSENRFAAPVVGSAVLNTITAPLVNKFSGEVLYLDHRAGIVRSAGETQDIKLVIQL